jgi:hypothetical protein
MKSQVLPVTALSRGHSLYDAPAFRPCILGALKGGTA